jgi:hypothetical protein
MEVGLKDFLVRRGSLVHLFLYLCCLHI